MEEEIKRVVINIGIVCSDEECDEDEMDYDRPGGSTDTVVQLIVQIKLRPLTRGYSYFWNKVRIYIMTEKVDSTMVLVIVFDYVHNSC
ncbi:hypothetical protein ANN_12589 [Periplaneta americana]|uniref:Uncharacterized protein n=1 Tax=Periplaneta americana TaxID=6978 RepID=A0ABQ8TGY6_PERAM|nr:hypothetical protein ANN_12589 [Periplaneta americana]